MIVTPCLDLFTNFGNEGRQELFVACLPQGLIRRKPAVIRIEYFVRGCRERRMNSHYLSPRLNREYTRMDANNIFFDSRPLAFTRGSFCICISFPFKYFRLSPPKEGGFWGVVFFLGFPVPSFHADEFYKDKILQPP